MLVYQVLHYIQPMRTATSKVHWVQSGVDPNDWICTSHTQYGGGIRSANLRCFPGILNPLHPMHSQLANGTMVLWQVRHITHNVSEQHVIRNRYGGVGGAGPSGAGKGTGGVGGAGATGPSAS